MKLLFVLITLMFLLRHNVSKQQLFLQQDPSKMLSFGNFLYFAGYRLNVTAQDTLEVGKEIQCTSSCLRKQECFSFNVEQKASGTFLCEFLNATRYRFPEKVTRFNNFVHWYLQVTDYSLINIISSSPTSHYF